MPGRWTGPSATDRRATLPADWAVRRRAVLDRDPVCTCTGCPRCSTPARTLGCARPSTDADHTGERTDHRLEALAGKCSECHSHRTAQQGTAARWRYKATREPERHPGLR